MTPKRIVSFLPSATEILYDLGAGDQVVGVTHECSFPSDAKSKPRVIHSSFDPNKMKSSEIDQKIVSLVREGADIYVIDDEVLKKADPDIIVAQGLCEVCSPFTKEVDRAVSILDKKVEVVVLDPHNLDDILSNILQVGRTIGKVEKAGKLVNDFSERIKYVKKNAPKSRKKILCIEWLDPPFTAGHWVPQMVEIAGGINGISLPNEPSRRIQLDEVIRFDPDVIVLMPCGFNIDRTIREYQFLANNSEWKSLRAVQKNNLFAVDANSYFSKPGPRTVTGLEILAKIIHPQTFEELQVPKDSYVQIKS